MEFHRSRPTFAILLFLLGGLVAIWASFNGWELRILFIPVGSVALLLVGVVCVLGAVAAFAGSLRSAPVKLSESGLQLDVPGVKEFVPWTAVDAVILEPRADGTPRLVLVPSADSAIVGRAEYANTVDGRPSIILMALDDVRETSDQVVRSFAVHAGQRFVNGVNGTNGVN